MSSCDFTILLVWILCINLSSSTTPCAQPMLHIASSAQYYYKLNVGENITVTCQRQCGSDIYEQWAITAHKIQENSTLQTAIDIFRGQVINISWLSGLTYSFISEELHSCDCSNMDRPMVNFSLRLSMELAVERLEKSKPLVLSCGVHSRWQTSIVNAKFSVVVDLDDDRREKDSCSCTNKANSTTNISCTTSNLTNISATGEIDPFTFDSVTHDGSKVMLCSILQLITTATIALSIIS